MNFNNSFPKVNQIFFLKYNDQVCCLNTLLNSSQYVTEHVTAYTNTEIQQ